MSKSPLPRFDQGSEFSSALRSRVAEYFRSQGATAKSSTGARMKAAFLLLVFTACYLGLVWGGFPVPGVIALATLTGVVVLLIGLNVLHELAHGSVFRSPMLNRLGGYLMDVFGISVDIYRVKHLEVHHRFTNVHRWDGDIDEGYPALRLSDQLPLRPIHRLQHWYALPLYSLLTLSWVISDDFLRLRSMKVCDFEMPPFSAGAKLRIVLLKLFHLSWAIGIPSLYHPLHLVLLTYVGIHLILGTGITIIFQLAHVFDSTIYVQSSGAEGDWMRHQLRTTADFATESRLARWLLGGLNYQVEHHLFPSVAYEHLHSIQRIVRRTCEEYKVPYHSYPGWGSAVRSHFVLLRRLGAGSESERVEKVRQSG